MWWNSSNFLNELAGCNDINNSCICKKCVCGMMELATLKCILLKDCLNFVVVNDFS